VYRSVTSAVPVEIPALFGSDDTLTVWLNGEKLLAANKPRACRLSDVEKNGVAVEIYEFVPWDGVEALCLRTPVGELAAVLEPFLRTQRIENHWWPVAVRACQRLEVAQAVALLEKLAADKPAWAGRCQEIIGGLAVLENKKQ